MPATQSGMQQPSQFGKIFENISRDLRKSLSLQQLSLKPSPRCKVLAFSWYYFKSIFKRHKHKELPLNVCGSASDMEHIRCSSLGCHQRHHVPGHLEVKLSSLMENFGRLLFQTMTLNLYHLPGNISLYSKKNKIRTTEEAGWQVIPSFLKPFELFRPRSV